MEVARTAQLSSYYGVKRSPCSSERPNPSGTDGGGSGTDSQALRHGQAWTRGARPPGTRTRGGRRGCGQEAAGAAGSERPPTGTPGLCKWGRGRAPPAPGSRGAARQRGPGARAGGCSELRAPWGSRLQLRPAGRPGAALAPLPVRPLPEPVRGPGPPGEPRAPIEGPVRGQGRRGGAPAAGAQRARRPRGGRAAGGGAAGPGAALGLEKGGRRPAAGSVSAEPSTPAGKNRRGLSRVLRGAPGAGTAPVGAPGRARVLGDPSVDTAGGRAAAPPPSAPPTWP